MRIGVLGTGMVGKTIAAKLSSLGHEVRMGARTKDNPKAREWVGVAGSGASHGTFADAAAFGDVLFNCTLGAATLAVLESAGSENLEGKVLIDIANPLDFSKGMPPSLFVSNTDSLGEQIQRAFPKTRVVKALNTMNADVMVDPSRVAGGEHDVFMCGNDPEAKAQVATLLKGGFGWRSIIDLGDISSSRATESYLLLWVRLWGLLGTADFNLKIVR